MGEIIDAVQSLAIIGFYFAWCNRATEDGEIWASIKKLWLAVYALKTGENYDSKNWPDPE